MKKTKLHRGWNESRKKKKKYCQPTFFHVLGQAVGILLVAAAFTYLYFNIVPIILSCIS